MYFALWMVLGAVSGAVLSGLLYRRSSRYAFAYLGGIVLGAFGGIVGGFVVQMAAMETAPKGSGWSLVAAVAGALAMMSGFHVLRRTGHGA